MATVVMQAPATWGGTVTDTPSGTVYAPDASGFINAQTVDVATLLTLGFISVLDLSSTVSILNCKNADGSVIAASAAAGKFGVSYTAGSLFALISEVANGNTKTDTFIADIPVPVGHVPGNNLTLDVNSNVVIGSGTLSARSLVVTAYKEDGAGALGSNLVASGGTMTVANTAGVTSAVITGTGIVAGDRLIIQGVLTLTETASSNVSARLNSLKLRG